MKPVLRAIIMALVFVPSKNSVVSINPFGLSWASRSWSTISPQSTPTGTSKLISIPRGGEVRELSTWEDVEAVLIRASAEGKLVVIDFSATWCGPCKMIAPLFHELSEMDDLQNVIFIKVDVDENPETAARYSVSAMPTFVFLKQGQVVDRLMGANPMKLHEMLKELSN